MGDRGKRCAGVESTNYWVEEEFKDTLQQLKEALPHLQINCSHFTTIARPTIGDKKNQEIWGIKCRLSLEKPSCL